MTYYTVRYRVAYADGASSSIQFKDVLADTAAEASEKVTRLEFQRPDGQPIRSVNIRAVEIVDPVERRAPKRPPDGETE